MGQTLTKRENVWIKKNEFVKKKLNCGALILNFMPTGLKTPIHDVFVQFSSDMCQCLAAASAWLSPVLWPGSDVISSTW